MRWIIFALISWNVCIAQPVNGPFLVASSAESERFDDVKIAVDASGIAHVFHSISESGLHSITYTAINALDGTLISDPTTVFIATTDYMYLEDLALTPSGVPKVLVYSVDPSDYRLTLVEQSDASWNETLLFQDHDGWSPEHGTLSHWLEYCRFAAAEDSFTQVCLFNSGFAGGWITEPFATPVTCFVSSSGVVSSFRLDAGGQATFGTVRCQSLAADSMYVWVDNNFTRIQKFIVRSDSTSDAIAEYSLDDCMYGELAGMSVSGGDQIHVSGMTLCIPACLIFERISGDSCIAVGDVHVYPPMDLPHTFAVYENHGFVFPLFDQIQVQLLRVDTLANIVAAAGTIGWRDGDAQITDAACGVSPSGLVAAAWTDHDPSTIVSRVWFASCDWLTPLNARETPAPVPQTLSLTTYPNPFNSTVRIDYELPRAGDVTLSIYNTLGQHVETLFDGQALAGTHSANWSPESASGVYLVRLESGEVVTSRKILYIR